MRVTFINSKEWGIETGQFKAVIRRLKTHLPSARGVLNVVFVNDPYIRALNKQYRKKDSATDVLSFPYLNSPDFPLTHLLGEVYISVPTAKRQAKEFRQTLTDELCKLLVHGCLHVFGYDHEREEDYKEMSALEKKILA